LLAAVFLGFANNGILQPILPLLILDQGGDATVVGAVLLAFTLPSIVLRPFVGYLVDAKPMVLTFGLGGVGLTVAGFLYLIPSLPGIFVARAVHGAAWAAFNTAGNAVLAQLAPPPRRAEASGMYNLMSNLAQLLAPASGLLLLQAYGFSGPFVAAGCIGAVAMVLVISGPVRGRDGTRTAAAASGFWSRLVDRQTLLPMSITLVWIAAQTLYVVYPPIFAAQYGIPISDLTLYYPVYGAALIIARLAARRATDRLPRVHVLAFGITLGIVSLGLAALADSMLGLLLGACLFGIGSSATTSVATAIAIDQAAPHRRGAVMATFSLAYPLGLGLGGAVWGVMIDNWGFPSPFVAALVCLGVVLGLVARGHRIAPSLNESATTANDTDPGDVTTRDGSEEPTSAQPGTHQ
jgi:MFS family permease